MRVALLGYEVGDWGNILVEQKQARPENNASAKCLAQIAGRLGSSGLPCGVTPVLAVIIRL